MQRLKGLLDNILGILLRPQFSMPAALLSVLWLRTMLPAVNVNAILNNIMIQLVLPIQNHPRWPSTHVFLNFMIYMPNLASWKEHNWTMNVKSKLTVSMFSLERIQTCLNHLSVPAAFLKARVFFLDVFVSMFLFIEPQFSFSD